MKKIVCVAANNLMCGKQRSVKLFCFLQTLKRFSGSDSVALDTVHFYNLGKHQILNMWPEWSDLKYVLNVSQYVYTWTQRCTDVKTERVSLLMDPKSPKRTDLTSPHALCCLLTHMSMISLHAERVESGHVFQRRKKRFFFPQSNY